MKKSTIETLNRLKQEDLQALSYLYLYRAMDVEQLMESVYNVDTTTPSGKRTRTIIKKRLMNESLVTVSVYKHEKEALQITNKGIDIVRYARDMPNEIFDENTKAVKRGYYTAADLKLNTRFLNHQIHLNQFMLDFEKKARNYNIPWSYYDEKFLSQYVGMRPDGMITILDHDLFLEIDMATESRAQLIDKWNGYRAFMQTSEFRYKSRKIIVLFDIDNIISEKKIQNRINLVKSTITETILDQINGDFEIIVKKKDDLIDYIFKSLVPRIFHKNNQENMILNYFNKSGYTTSYGYALNEKLLGDFYNYYIRKLTPDGKIENKLGILEEYFLDFYLDEEMSVLHRIDWYQKNTKLYREEYKRDIRLIVVTDDIEKLYEDFRLLGQRVLGQPNIFILDINSFNSRNDVFNNLCQFGIDGEVFSIVTKDLSRREFKYKIKEKEIRQNVGRVNEKGKKG